MRIKLLLIFIACYLLSVAAPYQTVFASDRDPYDGIKAADFDSSNVTIGARGDYVAMPRLLNQYLLFSDIVFTDAPYAIEIKSAIGYDLNSDNVFEIRIDSMSSEPISRVSMKECADWKNPVINIGTITQTITGTHDVYISTNRPNDFYSFSFLSVRKSDKLFKSYSEINQFADIKDYKYKNEINTLYGLGIINPAGDKQFDPERPMTRADFASWVAKLYTTDIPLSNQQVFSDVAVADRGFHEINYLYDYGVITKNEGDAFRPWDFIRASDAAEMLCRVLGYSQFAENKSIHGEYSIIASGLKLLSGISPNDYVRRGDGAKMIYQAINAVYTEPSSITNSVISYEKKKGILSQTRNIYKDTGIVTANQYGSLVSDISGSEGTCRIGVEQYDTGETNADAMIGIYCEFYYVYDQKKDIKTLIYIAPSSKTKQTIISTEKNEISEISSSVIAYEENGKSFKIKLKPIVNFIYNNKLLSKNISGLISAENFKGTIRLIDNGNGYETVVIDHYRNIKIGASDFKNQTLYDELKEEIIDFSDMKIYISDSVNPINMKKIIGGTFAIMYESQNTTGQKVIVIETGSVKKTGIIEEIADDTVVIGGEQYSVALEMNQNLFVGLNAVFYINKYNEIIGFDENISEKLLGILSDVKRENNIITISLITKTNTTQHFTAGKNIFIDGVRVSGFEDMMDGYKSFKGFNYIERYTPVLYSIGKDKNLVMLDTVQDGEKNEKDTLTALNSNNNTPYYYYSGLKAFVNDSTFDMPFPMRATGQVIFVQTESGGDYCAIGNYETMITSVDAHYYPYFYSKERDSVMVDVVFIKNQSTYNIENEYMLVDKVTTSVNSEGMCGLEIKGYQKSTKVNYWIHSDNTAYYNYAKALQSGDLIRITTDIKGELASFVAGCFYNGAVKNSAGMAPSVHINNGVSGSYNIKDNFVLGKIVKIQEGYLGIMPFGGTNTYWIKYSGVNINRVKQSDSGNVHIDVDMGDSLISVGDTVGVWIFNQNVNQITIYQTDAFMAK